VGKRLAHSGEWWMACKKVLKINLRSKQVMEVLQSLHPTRGNDMFDTLQYTKEAVEAGFTREQAEFQAEKMGELIGGTLVTKNYFKTEMGLNEKTFRHELTTMEKSLQHELHLVEMKLTNAIAGMGWRIIGGVTAIMTIGGTMMGMILHFAGKSV
jgi:hypothetical protein